MIIRADLTEALSSLWYAKQRTLLAVIGITIGIGAVIGLVSIGKIVQREAMKQFISMGTDILTLTRFSQNIRDADRILLEDVTAMVENIPSVKEVAPQVQGNKQATYSGQRFERSNVFGVTQSFPSINKLKVKEGRFLSDLDRLSYFAVVGHAIEEEMRSRGAEAMIGEKIKIGDRMFTVIGVLERSTAGRRMSIDADHAIFTHLTTQTRLDRQVEIQEIKIRIGPDDNHGQAMQGIRDYFSTRKNIQDVEVRSPEELIKQMQTQMELYTMLLGAIGSISLIVGGVGVMNVMLVSVTERRREIGVRRALGARRSNIKMQFLIESTTLSLLGGLLGIITGIVVSYYVARHGQWEFMISKSAIVLGVGVSTAIGMFFGFYPASQAAKLDPIQALRSD